LAAVEGVRGRLLLDSRGDRTIEVDVLCGAHRGRAAAPSGASTGSHEVRAWAPGGVEASLRAVPKLQEALRGADVADQAGIDHRLHALDGTADFSGLGGNLAVAVSLACARAAAAAAGKPLYAYLGGRQGMPRPLGNVIGGGAHAVGGTSIQEFLSTATAPRVAEAVFANARVHRAVRDRLREAFPGSPLGKGDEAAWVAALDDAKALALLAEVCRHVSAETGVACQPSLDVAATELWKDGRYHYRDASRRPEEQVAFLEGLVAEHGLAVLEDPLQEEDFAGFAELTRRVGGQCLIVGDDVFATSVERLRRGISEGAANAILVKPNQCGTLTDTRAAVDLAHRHGYKTVMSHRSGETTDDAIAHLAVAFGCWGIKTGAVGGERTAKLNELIRIEEMETHGS
jgi:enolase